MFRIVNSNYVPIVYNRRRRIILCSVVHIFIITQLFSLSDVVAAIVEIYSTKSGLSILIRELMMAAEGIFNFEH